MVGMWCTVKILAGAYPPTPIDAIKGDPVAVIVYGSLAAVVVLWNFYCTTRVDPKRGGLRGIALFALAGAIALHAAIWFAVWSGR